MKTRRVGGDGQNIEVRVNECPQCGAEVINLLNAIGTPEMLDAEPDNRNGNRMVFPDPLHPETRVTCQVAPPPRRMKNGEWDALKYDTFERFTDHYKTCKGRRAR